ncbi:MAG: hypothetical protein JNL80_13960 [Phycisphaerae bacterium]|nr:hypothetical protein [Phycisphaerae bacterium]
MGSGDVSFILLVALGGAVALGLAIALIAISVKVTGGLLKGIGWLIAHVVRFVAGVLTDAIGLVGSVLAALFAIPFATCNVVLARWETAGRWGGALKRETMNIGYRSYSLVLRRPLQLLCLDGILDGVEKRLPEDGTGASSMETAPLRRAATRSGPSEFEGYTIEGTLRPGGSGAKLYIATPDDDLRRRLGISSERVVIKSFALEEGSSLPQIVRESRALDSARALGLVFDHGLDGGRFWYAMPYHPGESLGETTRFLHAQAGNDGLRGQQLGEAIGYARDLVRTLARYHEGGLWHKDVKPDNIIVHDGRAHLVDLGLVTPLRSAMTLTTHGTEYFRDPEMVRQALRGVRVHQVDGGKFDVYGAGAVLYFLLENTFPAHGGLSSFMRRSPEALRWIVRRSMADYHQRYVNAKAMLDDLEAVVQAADPWAVRPIELPSMRSADLNAVGAVAGPAAVAAAGVGVGAGVGAGAGLGWGAAPAAAAGWMGGAAAIPMPAMRPRLVVTNWWSGSYASPQDADRIRFARTESAEAARAAREAVKAHRGARCATKRPCSRKAAFIGWLFPFACLCFGLVMAQRNDEASALGTTSTETALARAVAPKRLQAPTSGTKIVLINDHPAVANPDVATMLDQVIASYERAGFAVVRDDQDAVAKLSLELAKQHALRSDEPIDPVEIEAVLATSGYWGALQINAASGNGTPTERFMATPIGVTFSKAVADARKKRSSREKTPETSAPTTTSPRDTIPSLPPVAEPPVAPEAPAAPTVPTAAAPISVESAKLSLPRTSPPSTGADRLRRFAWQAPLVVHSVPHRRQVVSSAT